VADSVWSREEKEKEAEGTLIKSRRCLAFALGERTGERKRFMAMAAAPAAATWDLSPVE